MKRQIRKYPFNMVEIALAMAIIAIGLSGIDGHMIEAKVKDPALGYVGEIQSSRHRRVHHGLSAGGMQL